MFPFMFTQRALNSKVVLRAEGSTGRGRIVGISRSLSGNGYPAITLDDFVQTYRMRLSGIDGLPM